MKLVVEDGLVVQPHRIDRRNVVCVDGRIEALSSAPVANADEVIYAEGCLVFPGFIDAHVHSRDPGQTEKEEFEPLTRAAALGGITTICEMPNQLPPVRDRESFERRAAEREGKAHVDFAQYVIGLGEENLADLAATLEAGAIGVKIFWGYGLDRRTGALAYNLHEIPPEELIPPPSSGDVFRICETVAGLGAGLVSAHCEDPAIVHAAASRFGREWASYRDFLDARPALAECAAVAAAVEISRATGCRFHVLHMSSGRAAELVRRAQGEGVPISAETGPQYLTLSDSDHPRIDFMKVFPPIREEAEQELLWKAVADGTISSIGSDHAPHTEEQNRAPLHSQLAGMPGVQTIAPLMIREMCRGRLAPQRLAAILSEDTARLFGIHPAKGSLAVGSDADFTIVDPELEWTLAADDLAYKMPLSAWAGEQMQGAPVATVVRGEVVMRNGKILSPPRGRLVRSSAG
ncbi:MAG TPA: amidohydrolase family protein [Solirubrobacterales bacterium]|jgi:dihydroorotase